MTTHSQPIKNPLATHLILQLGILFFGSISFASTGWAGPLHDAAETGNLNQVQQLVAAVAAVTDGNTATVALLLKLKANPNQADQYQYTALHEAASLGYRDVAELLIDAKAGVNARDINGITPLGYALRSSSQEAVTLLQDVGGIQ